MSNGYKSAALLIAAFLCACLGIRHAQDIAALCGFIGGSLLLSVTGICYSWLPAIKLKATERQTPLAAVQALQQTETAGAGKIAA